MIVGVIVVLGLVLLLALAVVLRWRSDGRAW